MRPELLLLALFVASAGCFGGGKGSPDEPLPTTGSVTGVVVTQAIQPIVGANVSIQGGNSTTTDATGAFNLSGLAPGSYIVQATAPSYLGEQTTVQITAGNATRLRLVLSVDLAAVAFNQSFTFRGFVEASAGPTAPELGDCLCNFTVPLEGDWRTIVVEAQWEDAVASPAAPTEFAWELLVASDQFQGQGASPFVGRADANGTSTADTALVRVTPASTHVFANQQFDVAVTVFYGLPAPPQFRTLG